MPGTMKAASATDFRTPRAAVELAAPEECAQASRLPEAGARVTLTVDIPDLGLQRGTAGVVCSQWFAPIAAYEVEFAGPSCTLRALLLRDHFCTAE